MDKIQDTRNAMYETYVALKDFILAYEEQNPEQLLGAYHQALKAIEHWDKTQAVLEAHIRKSDVAHNAEEQVTTSVVAKDGAE